MACETWCETCEACCAVLAIDSFVYTISCDIVDPDKPKETDVAKRGLGRLFFFLAFSWQLRCDAKETAEQN